jgi:uroporphyrin-3 C-methyltransferase
MNDEINPQTPPLPPEADAPSTAPATPTAETEPAPPPNSNSPAGSGKSSFFSPWLIVALLALGLAGWQWMETRLRLAEVQHEMARRLTANDTATSESRTLAKQTQEQLTALQGKLSELEGLLAESKSQQEVLGNLYQNLARNNEESVLTEIEQSVTLASQQLQLAGNIQGAVLALQTADTRLADSGQPQFINLRKVLTHDLERLRALPQLDLPGMYLRLENVIGAIDTLPLAMADRPHDESPATMPAEPPPLFSPDYWKALANDFWQEMRGLVRIERIDRVEPAMLPPGQNFFLRENIKLRLLNARLALFAHDQQTYRSELYQSSAWIERYFDRNGKSVQISLQTLEQLAATEISIELPNLNESLSAIKRFRAEKEQR